MNFSLAVTNHVQRFRSIEKEIRNKYEALTDKQYGPTALLISVVQFISAYFLHSLPMLIVATAISTFILICSFGSEKAFAKKIKSSITRFFWEKKIQFEIRTTKQQIKEELTEIRKEILGMNKGDATVKDIAADAIQILMLKVA